MARNPQADMIVQVVTDPAQADEHVTLVGDQVLTATPADVGKVVTVDADGTLHLSAAAGGGLTQAEVDARVTLALDALIDGAPGALNTLNELAAAVNDDATFAAAVTAALAAKAPLASPNLTGTPLAPTAADGTNTTQLATTAFVQTAAGLLVPKATLTTDGDLLTRAGGVIARMTRAQLAADAAFTAAFAPVAGSLGGPPLRAFKSAIESVTSSATLQDDDHLLVAGVANAEYMVEVNLLAQGLATADLKVGVEAPTGSSITYGGLGVVATVAAVTGDVIAQVFTEAGAAVTGTPFALAGATTPVLIILRAFVAMGATPGNIKLVWAQNTSQGTATSLLAGSSLIAHRVGA